MLSGRRGDKHLLFLIENKLRPNLCAKAINVQGSGAREGGLRLGNLDSPSHSSKPGQAEARPHALSRSP